ncbi:unnamed protein product [Mytilus coruscus]|uniref:Uncharacterized protein n=1 Tax=Mytilus coruscus TaxID=42192 RepID=A0A6J8E9I0_MYTCO|nr:unnamed protein product [Mytilus coruscus]
MEEISLAPYVDSKALELAEISKDTPNNPGGIIMKDPNTGDPNGIFYENARHEIMDVAIKKGWKHILNNFKQDFGYDDGFEFHIHAMGNRGVEEKGGELVAYARSDLVFDRKCNVEFKSVESICVDFVNDKKLLTAGLYRPPSMSNSEFSKIFKDTFDKASTKSDNILMLDINYDMLVNEK